VRALIKVTGALVRGEQRVSTQELFARLAVLVFAITRLLQYQHETQRICADDPSASVCGR
jgi:hypothetical protein